MKKEKLVKEEVIYFSKEETNCWTFKLLSVKGLKVVVPGIVQKVGSALCCTWNYCQHFICEKTLLKEEFWGLSFEECKTYGMDIPKRLHVRANLNHESLSRFKK
jgi:hypothetical protein